MTVYHKTAHVIGDNVFFIYINMVFMNKKFRQKTYDIYYVFVEVLWLKSRIRAAH